MQIGLVHIFKPQANVGILAHSFSSKRFTLKVANSPFGNGIFTEIASKSYLGWTLFKTSLRWQLQFAIVTHQWRNINGRISEKTFAKHYASVSWCSAMTNGRLEAMHSSHESSSNGRMPYDVEPTFSLKWRAYSRNLTLAWRSL